MSHFKALQSREDFQLSSGCKVPGTVAQYLRGFQLEGVKFLAEHLIKNKDSCILNDQSGLGKTAVVVAFLSAIPGSKTLIVVNDESNVLHWQYHFEKLAGISVGTIDDCASSKENIQLVRWSSMVNNPRITQKFNFHLVILDNRGNCLSNKICESFLLKHLEKKVQLLIASEDLTSDLELFYVSLRLIGRLEKKFEKKSAFVNRFSMPEAQDKLLLEKDFLENYFMLRNIIRDYCGSYRLRRYVHQYEPLMPLTNKTDYEKHFQNWLGISNNICFTNNISSQESLKIVSSDTSTSTNELFETLYLAPKSQDIGQNAQQLCVSDCEEDVMPPLMFEDESDPEQPETKKSSPPKKQKEPKKKAPVEKKKIDDEERKRIKLVKMLEIDFTSKYQINKTILKEAEKPEPKEKKEVKRLSPVKMLLPIREPKLKEKPVNKQLEKLKKLLDIDCTPKHQFNKNVLDEVIKEEKKDPDEKVSKKKVKKVIKDKEKKVNPKVENDQKTPQKKKIKSNTNKTPEELKRERLEKLLQIDFTPKYQLNNIKTPKTKKVPTPRDLKETPKERKKAKEQSTIFQNAQKFVESASPDTTTQDFIPAINAEIFTNEIRSIDLGKEIEKLKNDTVVVVENPPAPIDVIVLSDEDDEEDDYVKSPDIFGGRLDELITDDESINCSQTLPKTQMPPTVQPAKPKKSCLQQLESQDPSTDGHNFMDVYSEFLQAQKSNETSPFKSTTNNSKPISTGNKITKYFGGTSSAIQAREVLKTPTRRKSFCAMRRSPKTPPNIQNNNIMTWLVRPSSSNAIDHQDSSITSSSKDIKRRRLNY